MSIFDYLNKYNGLILVFVTIAYSVITFFMYRSAKKQLEQSYEQQLQNVGIELYEKKMRVYKNIIEEKYAEAFLESMILFDENIQNDISKLNNLKESIDNLYKEREYVLDMLREYSPDVYEDVVNMLNEGNSLPRDLSLVYFDKNDDNNKKYCYERVEEEITELMNKSKLLKGKLVASIPELIRKDIAYKS